MQRVHLSRAEQRRGVGARSDPGRREPCRNKPTNASKTMRVRVFRPRKHGLSSGSPARRGELVLERVRGPRQAGGSGGAARQSRQPHGKGRGVRGEQPRRFGLFQHSVFFFSLLWLPLPRENYSPCPLPLSLRRPRLRYPARVELHDAAAEAGGGIAAGRHAAEGKFKIMLKMKSGVCCYCQ